MSNEDYLHILTGRLSVNIPYKWRVQSFSKFKPEATVVAYIDARDLMDLLDRSCEYGWTRRHYDVCGNVYCAIGIYMPDGKLIERSDCGVESNMDAKKGEASDSFKRAGVNWGGGRFLYDLPMQYLATNCKKEGNNYPHCIDEKGNKIYDITKYVNGKGQSLVLPTEPALLTLEMALKDVKEAKDLKELQACWLKYNAYQKVPAFMEAKEEMKGKLK